MMEYSSYYYLVPKGFRKHYTVFWIVLSIAAATVALVMLRALGEILSLETVIAVWSLLVVIPVSHLNISNEFHAMASDLKTFFKCDANEFRKWYQERLQSIFSAKSPVMWTTAILTNIVCTAIVVQLGLPLQSSWLNALALIVFEVVAFASGQSVYTLLAELRLLKQFTNFAQCPHFYQSMPATLRKLSTMYLKSSVYILLVYLAVLIAIVRGPYGIPPILMLVLVGIAVFPTIYIMYSVFQIHLLMVKLREGTLAIIDKRIQQVLAENWIIISGVDSEFVDSDVDEPDLDKVNCLAKLMDLRDKVEKMREWPWNFEGRITFTVSILTSIVQVVVAVQDLS